MRRLFLPRIEIYCVIANSFAEELVCTFLYLSTWFFWTTTELNLFQFITIFHKTSIALLLSDVRIIVSSANVFANDDNVILSEKLCTEACFKQKKESFKNGLNTKWPTIEPCGSLEIIVLK